MAKILLGVTGSIAAYRACDVARELMREGHPVQAVLTRAATRLISPDTFAALTGKPVVVDVFDEPVPGQIAHIQLAQEADLVLIAPATAHTIARLALGLADDMLTTLALATRAPILIAPAMNPAMWSHPATQAHVATLRERGVEFHRACLRDYGVRRRGLGQTRRHARDCASGGVAPAPRQRPAGRACANHRRTRPTSR
jgi:phosphopantothenoylcysteine decarboxylase/phosphopantothenate--cysteine ligase